MKNDTTYAVSIGTLVGREKMREIRKAVATANRPKRSTKRK